ncbi:MAG: DUF4863 family protein [Planctomycetota bacterium]
MNSETDRKPLDRRPSGRTRRLLAHVRGVEKATVHRDRERSFSAMFLRFAPGARAPRHVHPEGEQYWVIEGAIEDESGRYEAGTWVALSPGSVHEPHSPEGALVLVTWFGRLEAYGAGEPASPDA